MNTIDTGFVYPNYNPPQHLLDALRDLSANDSWKTHQYPIFRGELRLRRAITKLNEPLVKRHIDADREVLVTVGAIQALDLAAKSYVSPGDDPRFFHRSNKTADIFNGKEADTFLEIEMLSHQYKSLSFASNYPNYMPSKHMMQAFRSVAQNETTYAIHHLGSCRGDPRLRAAIAYLYSILMKRPIHADKEIAVTTGAMQALYLLAKAYINAGDEVIMFEPFFKRLEIIIKISGGIPVFVPLNTVSGQKARQSNDLTFNRKELEAAFTNRTKMIWLVNPNNPTGKIFTEEELLFIGELCKKHDVIILSDEVYQFHTFEGPKHTRIATLPGLWSRTVTVNSGGKIFSSTGWRIGWIIGPEELLWGVYIGMNALVRAPPTPTQMAFAIGLEMENKILNTDESYYQSLVKYTIAKRDRMLKILSDAGIDFVKPNSGQVVMANFTNVINKIDLSTESDQKADFRLMNWLMKHKQKIVTLFSIS
ncbi:unnamed protein product [Medioppia subpectinata]|uniref:Aminotransferase class I/classII large domain-containing protein n=1 Tax=Medioppia subpectinata TaxID=1979941 RepID=A0A7R9KDE9_9ACAR|nr:unnamed protein product [Medioppia subpectinata]CAG2101052.1 unnamed protein product [Medioppia subpectinata]